MRFLRLNPKGLLKDAQRRRMLRRSGIRVEAEVDTFRAGERSGTWSVATAGLGPDSVVYSFGLGDNIAWELALIERFGLTVHAFDPTPRAVAWTKRQSLPPGLVFKPLGLGERDGEQAFAPPRHARSFNYRPLSGSSTPSDGVRCPVRSLSSLQGSLGHDRIDVLKLDIEGGEVAVLDDVIAARPGQLLIEFHHGADGTGFDRTLDAFARLRRAGYRVFFISRRGVEFGLLL